MLKTVVNIIIILFYISLFIELFFYSIPSVVTTKKMLSPHLPQSNLFSDNVKRVLNWSLSKKIIVFFLPLIVIYILHALPAYFLFQINYGDRLLDNVNFTFYLGILLVILGRIISHRYLRDIKKIKAKTFDGFVATGLFKFSRNPGLLSLYTSFFGFYLMTPSIFFLLCLIVYIAHMHYKIIMEEDYLMNKHKEDYKTYLQKTKRYL